MVKDRQPFDFVDAVTDPLNDSNANGRATLTYDEASRQTVLNLYANDGDIIADLAVFIDGQHLTPVGMEGIVYG